MRAERHYMDAIAGDLEMCAARMREAGDKVTNLRDAVAFARERLEEVVTTLRAIEVRFSIMEGDR